MKKTNKLQKIIKITLIIVLLLTSFIIGFGVGSKSATPKSTNGTYNIDVYRNGKAVITTKIQNIESDNKNNKLIIHGTSRYKTK